MAQQVINIGASPNDGTGDQLRTAFEKCNDNFTELYAGTGGGAVDSVNGQTGVVVLDATDVDALQRDGSNANSDIDIDTFSFNAKSLHAKGTAGAGHLGLKHQSSNATASASETSLFAGSDGELYYKNDGNAVQQLASQSFVNSGLATKENTITAGTTSQYYRGDKTFQTLNVGAVSGLQTALNGKITQNDWVDYSSLSTINGFASLSTVVIKYIPIGKSFLYYFYIAGVSNSGGFSFTIHTNHLGNVYYTPGGINRSNGTLSANPPRITVNSNSNVITLHTTLAAAAWGAANGKEASGWFIVESN